MKSTFCIALTALAFGASAAMTAGEEATPQVPHPGVEGGPSTSAVTPEGVGRAMPMMSMHEQMQKMRTEMARIRETKDPAKREELIEAHMASMRVTW
jgi:hypothetical protein